MLTIHITEAEGTTLTADTPGSPDDFIACLAQYDVAPAIIQTALAALPQVKTVVLCKPSEAAAWEIALPRGILP